MAQQLDFQLNIMANSSNAKTQIQELQTMLHQISTSTSINVDPGSMAQASKAAQELSVHLNNAYNATTGNFDLSKLDMSLKTSGQNLQQLTQNLLQAGSMGEQAFAKLARSIALADRPLVAMNAKLQSLGTTLMNTMKWQLSSTMLHGFIGAISTAYNYAQDLNESLNNIRIVTGKTTDQMAQFATQANAAAKALNTTTTAYTDAALIYYQQGDSTAEVIEKANITVKMANVVGQSAASVSDQLTAIWNNFDDGVTSLEYYVDVITALGAATASSTDEIAQGLEKFASVANTVGLSYEYATSALATVVAQTRQSADVVGTAFKTLFARLQDLKLGETLDDGTTLGQYTENLKKVGVNIKTASGELKDMDQILDETAARWKTLDRDQQTALAKGVAGIRQYSQFIALMDNWDFMEENLQTIELASGTLNEQSEIYAEGWEGAAKQVKASAEAIYSALLNDDFFIEMNHGFSGLLDSVGAFIDSMGGVGGILTMISSILMVKFAGKIGPAIQSLAHSFSIMFQSAQVQASGLAAQMNQVVDATLKIDADNKKDGQSGFSQETVASLEGSKQLNQAKSKMVVTEKQLTSLERQRYSTQLSMIEAQQNEVEVIARRIDKLKEEKEAILDKQEAGKLMEFGADTDKRASKGLNSMVDEARSQVNAARLDAQTAPDGAQAELANANLQAAAQNYANAKTAAEQYTMTQQAVIAATGEADAMFRQISSSIDFATIENTEYNQEAQQLTQTIQGAFGSALSDVQTRLQTNADAVNSSEVAFVSFRDQIDLLIASMPSVVRESQGMQMALDDLFKATSSQDLESVLKQVSVALEQCGINGKDFATVLKEINPQRYMQLRENANKTSKELQRLKTAQDAVNRAIKQFKPEHAISGLEMITKTAGSFSSLAMAVQSVRSAFQAWQNDDLSIGEKITTSLISFGMVIPMLTTGLGGLMTILKGVVGVMGTQLVAAAQADVIATVAQSAAKDEYISTLTVEQITQKYLVSQDAAQLILSTAKLSALSAESLAIKDLTTAEGQELLTKKAKNLATYAEISTEQAAVIIKAISAGKTKEQAFAEAGLTIEKKKGLLGTIANIGATITEAIAKKASQKATEGSTASLWAETAAKIASQAAAWPMLVVTLLLVAAIGALVLIIWAVVSAFKAFAANSPEGQLKAAEETAAELATALENAKEKAEELKSAFDAYDEVIKKLEACEKGTREWAEALSEVNAEALELIKNNPELTTMVNTDKDSEHYGESAISYGDSGEMIIADWAREQLTDAANQDVLVAQAAAIEGNQNVREKQIVIKEQDFLDAAYAAAGYNNSGVANLIKENAEELSKMGRDDQRDFLQKLMEDNNMMSYYAGDGVYVQDNVDRWMDVLDEVGSKFDDLTNAIDENTAATDAENRAIASSALADNAIVQSSNLVNDVINVSGHMYEQLAKEALDQLEGSEWGTEGINKGTKVNDEAEKIFAEYAEAAGLVGAKLVDTTGTDKKRKFVYTDANGEEQTVSLEAMRIAKASFDALNKLDGIAQQLTAKFEYLAAKTDDVGRSFAGLQHFLADQNLYQASETEVNDLKSLVAESGGIEGFLDEQIGDGDGNLSDATAQKYGFESAAAMIEEYEKWLEKVEEEWNKVKETIPDTIKGIEQVSLAGAQALAKDYKEIASGPGGDEAVAAFTERLEYLQTVMSPDKYEEFLEQIGNVDWSNWNALDDVSAILDDLDISLDLTSDKWVEFTNKMREAGAANPAEHFKNIKNNLTGLGDAIKGVNPGDLIDETQYQSLIALNEDLADSFIQTADGYKYIGTERIGVNELGLENDLKDMNEHSRVFSAAREAYNKSSISKMASSAFDTTDYKAEAQALEDEIDTKVANKKKELGQGAGGGWYGKDDKAKAADYEEGLQEEVAQKRKQQEEADARNKQLEEDLKSMGNEILADKSLMEVAKAMNYDEAMIQEMINSGNYEGLQKLAKNVNTYMQEGLAGAYDSTELQEKMAATATNVQELNQMMYDGLITDTEVYQKQLTALTMDGIINAENLQQLQDAMNTGGEYSYQLVADALLRMGEEYDNCAQEMDAFKQAMASGDEVAIKTAESALQASIMIGEAADKYGFDANEMEVQATQMAEAYGISAKAAAKLVIENQRMNNGVVSLVENLEDWKKQLSSSNKTTTDYAKAAAALTKTIADLVGASEDLELSSEFLEAPETMALIEKAAKGDADAINALGAAVAKESINLMNLDRVLQDNTEKSISVDQFENAKKNVLRGIEELQNAVIDGSIAVGDSVGSMGTDWAKNLNEMAMATGMSVEQMNSLLSSMGVDAEVVTEYVKQTTKVPVYETITSAPEPYGEEGSGMTKQTSQTNMIGYEEMEGVVPVAQINMGENGRSPNIKFIGNGSVSTSSTAKSGGSKPKKADKVKKSDVVERYKEVDDSLEKVADSMEDASKAMDRLYGASRLQSMQKQNNLMKQEIDLLKQKKVEALNYLEEDKKALAEMAKEAGVVLEIDENGLITNYTDAMSKIYNELDAAIASANKDGNADEDEQEKIDAIQDRADKLQEAIDQYDDTRSIIDDLNNELDDKFYEWQDSNAEMLSYKLELKLEINDMELEEIEYELSKIEDDFYSMAEAAALMVNANASTTGTSQLGIYKQELADYADQVTALNNAYNETDPSSSEISQAAYIEGLKEAKSGIIENLQSLQELDKSMMEYYGNTLDMAAEEIAKYTDRMDHQTAVLDHYSSLLEIMGKSNDYKTMGKVLEGKAKTIGDQAAVAKKTMEMYKGQAADRLAEYQQALASGDKAAAELYLKQYEAALAAANEAEDNYLSKAEEWAEALKAVLENKLADLAETLEDALTGGTSFDSIATSMERANSLQEDYLTTTNKIYETNKMINTAQKEIDKTTNTVAKQRLKNFQQETSQLQNKSKLSQYELDIQQAKYDLLLAEIALEEAQQAKSTVRLRRDSEGNFGYVYTADANAISDAEQKVADAQNALYNKGLEGANDYVQKYQETMSEMYDTLKEIQEQYLNGEFATEEEYHREMEKAKEYYFQKLQDYSSLYQVALTTDSRVVADAWSTDFADMTYNTEQWEIAVNDYVQKVEIAFGGWQEQLKDIAEDTSLDTLEENIKDITDESEKLKETIIGEDGVVDAIEEEINAVSNITSQYATLRGTLQQLMDDYKDLGKSIDEAVRKQQMAEASVSSNTSTFNPDTVGSKGSSGGSSGNGSKGTGPGVNPDGGDNICPKCGKNKKDCTCNKNVTKVYPVELAADPYGYVKMGRVDAKSINGKKDFTITDLGTKTSYGYTFHSTKGSGYITKVDYDRLNEFDTGGYTGSWGSEGKLAMLHQKELVLNPEDTTNFLASLEVLREIISVINLHSMNAQLAGLLSTPYYTNNTETQTLEQQVHIEASFPNVQDRHEIEDAFNNLINRAAQFVNRK